MLTRRPPATPAKLVCSAVWGMMLTAKRTPSETGGSLRLSIIAGQEIESYVAPKGSIALDGVSLTVNEVETLSDGVRFGVNIIPHTAAQTSFSDIAPGRRLNIEIDVLARYIGRIMELRR